MSKAMEGIRLRLIFKEPNILSETQKSEGLNQTWLFFKPQQHKTINDLSSFLCNKFQLHGSCPHGIHFSMDGFVLPPFESTCILKDKDIISVNKKAGHLDVEGNNGEEMILAVEGNNGPTIVENLQNIEKQRVIGGPLLLANEEFGHGSGGSDSEESEDESEKEEAEPKEDTSHQQNALGSNVISKKRKAPETLPSSKKTKHHHDAEEKIDEKTKKQQYHTPNNKDMEKGSAESSEDNHITLCTNKNDELQNGVENAEAKPNSGATKKKCPSRTARRKANKRRWLREMAKIQEKNAVTESEGLRNWKEMQAKAGKGEPSCQPNGRVNDEANGKPKGHRNWKQQKTTAKKEEVTGKLKGLMHWKQFQGGDKNRDANQEKHAEEKNKACGKPSRSSETEDEVVPVEIRPGHIRFEPLGKGQVLKQSQVEVESFKRNGGMSKKKGKNWGQENVSFSQKNDSLGSNKQHHEMVNGERQTWGQEKVSFSQKDDSLDSNKENSEMMNGEKEPQVCESIDFKSLTFFSGLPKEGLVIAYRLIELSSTWTPQVSSYRVGKISQYNSETNRVLLMPVAEFPLISSDYESSNQPDSFIYNEDGSLEIDFSSLLEVRLVKNGAPGPAGTPGRVIERSATVLGSSNKKSETPAAGAGEVNNGKQAQSTPLENGGVNLLEQLSETLEAKKAELLSKGSSSDKESSGKSSWSYRAMTGGALGPTMAFLRSQNEI